MFDPYNLDDKANTAAYNVKNQSHVVYGNCFKISNNLPFLVSNKLSVIRAGIPKILVRIIMANREDPDQTASSEAV